MRGNIYKSYMYYRNMLCMKYISTESWHGKNILISYRRVLAAVANLFVFIMWQQKYFSFSLNYKTLAISATYLLQERADSWSRWVQIITILN